MNNIINIINLGGKVIGGFVLCYFFKRLIEWCIGKPRVKTNEHVELNSKGKTLGDYLVALGDYLNKPVVKTKGEQKQHIIDERNRILRNEVRPEEIEKILKDIIFPQIKNKKILVSDAALWAVNKITDHFVNASPINAKSLEILIIQIKNFLENNSCSDYHKNVLVQFMQLALSEYSTLDPLVQDVKMLDDLTRFLLNYSFGDRHYLTVLRIREQCVPSYDSELLREMAGLMISILNDTEYTVCDKRAMDVLKAIMGYSSLKAQSDYILLKEQATNAITAFTKKEKEETRKFYDFNGG